MVYEINRNLVNKGIDVEVVAPNSNDYKNYEILDSIKIHRFNYFYPKKFQKLAYGAGIPTNLRKSVLAKIQVPFFALSFLFKAIKISKNCNIIHAQWIESGLIGILVKQFVQKPIIVTVRRVSKNNFMRIIEKFVLKNSDHVIFNSSYTMKESLEIFKPKSYSIIHNSVDIQKFKPFETEYKEKIGIKKNTKVILFLGLLVEKKGIKFLIETFKNVLTEYKDAVLVIGGHGPEYDSLTNLAEELEISEKVLFLGEIKSDETPELFNIADLFVLPSIIDSHGETETLGVVLLEAMSCGVPVIASDVGGIPDIVDNKTGFLVEQKNIELITQKILILLNDPILRKNFGKAGREKIFENFSPEKQIEKTISVYKSLIA